MSAAKHNPLTPAERDALESMIDSKSLLAIVDALQDICDAKAQHVLTNWQDKPLARAWDYCHRRLTLVKEAAGDLP